MGASGTPKEALEAHPRGRCGPQDRPGDDARPAPSVPDGAHGEAVLGVIPNAALRRGLFSRPVFSLVVTTERIIAARVTSAMVREEARRATAEAKANGKGIGGRFLATIGAGFTFHERYLGMSPSEALREHESNFDVAATSVKSVRRRTYLSDEDARQRQDELVLVLDPGGKLRFRLAPNAGAQAAGLLRTLLGDRVR